MADFQLVMPKMGESIMEATILKWHKQVGDHVEVDETILEIATDKVDSEIPSPVSGKIREILFKENAVVEVGSIVALIETSDAGVEIKPVVPAVSPPYDEKVREEFEFEDEPEPELVYNSELSSKEVYRGKKFPPVSNGRFYSPLVRMIAQEEGLTLHQLNQVSGSGLQGRVTKNDILSFIEELKHPAEQVSKSPKEEIRIPESTSNIPEALIPPSVGKSVSGQDEIIQMDRMRKIIAEHMVQSKRIAPHVTSFVEVDVTDVVKWRDKHKENFAKQHGTKLTFTPIFIHAIVKAITDFPMINISVNGEEIIVKKNINIGMATALPSGNLIVPVIKNADDYSLAGLAKKVNDLADRARKNELKPDEISGGTFTLTNVGVFGNVMGTPIINQPQVAILATGAIKKKPAVVETEYGDLIAIRHMMFLSMSYDHRVVDGFMGGSFLRKVADYLEQFSHDDII
jgi:2-oxoglutarate dehydrogenase E2 component (dihydrolipoamide succinyltransferase)